MSRPAQKIIVKPRDAKRGEKGKPALAAWPNDFGGFNWKLEDGWHLVNPDGEVFTTGRDGDAYLNGYSDEQKQKHDEETPADLDENGQPIYEDDIPF